MSGWPSIPLSKIITERCGAVDPAKYPDEPFDLYSIPAFDRGTPEVSTGREIGSAKQIVQPGDVLLAKIIPHIRRSWVVGENRGRRLIASGEWIVFRSTSIHPPYLRHVLVGDQFHAKFMQTVSGVGGSLLRARPAHVAKISIPLPPLAEQRRISAILDKADAIRRKRAETVQLSKDFLRSTFLEMFGDPMTNPKGWPIHRLGKHLTFVTSGSRGWAQYYASTGARFLRSLDIQMNHISDSDAVFVNPPDSAETRRTLVHPNDVLLTITGSRIGRVAPVNSSVGEAHISQHVAILRLNSSIRSPFLSMFLSEARGGQQQIRRMQYGQTKPGLNLEQLRAFEIPCPPLSMQDQFCSIWHKFDVHTQHHEAAKQQTEDLFNSLVQRAFRGEL